MIDIRLSSHEDLTDLKKLWKLCFGDEDPYIDLYYRIRYRKEETAVLFLDGRLAAMLTMLPVQLVLQDESRLSTAMIYAVGTHPDLRNRGLSRKLMQYAEDHLQSNQVQATVLVPASSDLFDFYSKLGYRSAFYVREMELHQKNIKENVESNHPITIDVIDDKRYNEIRKIHCTGYPYISYDDIDVNFQKKISMLSGEDIYCINSPHGPGCCAIERLSEETVIIKELLVGDHLMSSALKEISKVVPADKYIVRTPPFLDEQVVGTPKAFGMLKMVDGSCSNLDNCAKGYLGIAFD